MAKHEPFTTTCVYCRLVISDPAALYCRRCMMRLPEFRCCACDQTRPASEHWGEVILTLDDSPCAPHFPVQQCRGCAEQRAALRGTVEVARWDHRRVCNLAHSLGAKAPPAPPDTAFRCRLCGQERLGKPAHVVKDFTAHGRKLTGVTFCQFCWGRLSHPGQAAELQRALEELATHHGVEIVSA